jgi:UDP-glucuronate 4-epimerase
VVRIDPPTNPEVIAAALHPYAAPGATSGRLLLFLFDSLLCMTVLVTGAAGFIGYHLSRRLLEQGTPVVGFDNVNPYYDPSLKRARIAQLEAAASEAGTPFQLIEADLEDREAVEAAFQQHKPQKVVNLAAQAGVRYSIENPAAYIQSNLVGFGHILEACRHHGVGHLVYASSSSVYGGNKRMPFSEHHGVDHPVSLYAASKKANELMAHRIWRCFCSPRRCWRVSRFGCLTTARWCAISPM